MTSNELRKGNYVMYKERGILPITAYAIHLFEKEWIMKTKTYEPIPLTEEWIVNKLGFFASTKNNNIFDLGVYRIYKTKDIFEFFVLDTDYEDVSFCKLRDITYVHQLQNLYFTLTGSELVLSNVPEATKPAL